MEYPSLTILAELCRVGQAFGNEVSDKNAASHKYCETATQVLDRLEREGESYEARVIGLWVALGYISDQYPLLVPGPATTELCHKLFRQCARTVLNIKWQQLDDDTTCKKNFQAALQAFDNLMTRNGYTRFSLILSLNESNWTHHVLSRIMNWEDDDEHSATETEEAEQYIQAQDPVVLKLRVEMLLQESCEEFALSLCGWCLRHPALRDDLDIHQTQLMLLHRLHHTDRLQEECQKISCHDGVRLIKRLQLTESNGPLCTILAQTFLIQDWIRISSVHCCTKDLLKLWIQHQAQVDQDEEKFLSSIWAVAKLSSSSELIGLLIESLRQERGDELAQLYTDLFRFGVNLDKQVLEKLGKEGDQDDLNSQLIIISGTCRKLGEIYADIHTKTAKACYLTAFSLHPTQMLLHAVERCWKGAHVSIFPESETQNLENINDTTSRDQGIISIASLYEVERLLEVLRPSFLNPESSWDLLRSVCEKYLFEKQALAKQRALQSSTPSSEDTDLDSSSILETSSQDSQDSGELVEEMFDPTASPGSLSQQASVEELSSQSSPASSLSALPHGVFDRAVVASSASSVPIAAHGSAPSLPQKVMVQVSLPSTVANFQLPLPQLQNSGENLPRLLPRSCSMAGLMISQQQMPSYSMAPSSGTNVTTSTSTLVQGLADMTVGSGDCRASQSAIAQASAGLVADDILRLAQETVAGLPAGSQVFIASTQVKQQLIIAVTPSSDGNIFMPEGNVNMAYTPCVQVSNNPVGIFPSVPRFPSANSRRPLMKANNTPTTVARSAAASKAATATMTKAQSQAAISTFASSHFSTQLSSHDGGSDLLVNPVDPNACALGTSNTYPVYSDGNGMLDLGYEYPEGLHGRVLSRPQTEQRKFQGHSFPRSPDLGGSGAESNDDAILQSLQPGLKLEGGLYTEVVRSQPKKKKKKPVRKQELGLAVEVISAGMPMAPKQTLLVSNNSASPGPEQGNRNLPMYCGALPLPLSAQSQGLASASPSTSGKPSSAELNGSPEASSSPGAHSMQSTSDGNNADDMTRTAYGRYKRYNKTYFTSFYKCIICGVLLENFHQLRKHVKEACRAHDKRNKDTQHDMKQIIRGTRVIKCTTCNAMCDTDKDVKYHQDNCVAIRSKKARAEKMQEYHASPKKAVPATLQAASVAKTGEASSLGACEKTEAKILPSTAENPCPSNPSVIIPISLSTSGTLAQPLVSPLNSIPSVSGINNQVLSVNQQILPSRVGAVQSVLPTTSASTGPSVFTSASACPSVFTSASACPSVFTSASAGPSVFTSASACPSVFTSASACPSVFTSDVAPVSSRPSPMQTNTLTFQKNIPTVVQGLIQPTEAFQSAHRVTPAASYSQSLGRGLPTLGTGAVPVAIAPAAGNCIAMNSDPPSWLVQSQHMYSPSIVPSSSTFLPQEEIFTASRAPAPHVEFTGSHVPILPRPSIAPPVEPQTVSTNVVTQAQSISNGDLGTVNLEHASGLQLLCAGGEVDKQSSLDGAGETLAVQDVKKKKVRKKVPKKKKEERKEMDAECKGASNDAMTPNIKGLPEPMYDVLKSSVGTCFYKCKLCFVSFSSQENFSDHWEACLQKKPLSTKKAVKRWPSYSYQSRRFRNSQRQRSKAFSVSLHSNTSGSEEESSPGSNATALASPASGADGSRGSAEEWDSEEGERGRGAKKKGVKQVCEQCKLVFKDQPSYIKHICSRHIKSYVFQNTGNRFKFTCIMCEGIHSTFFNVMNHMVSHADLVLKTFSEKIADGTVQDFNPAKQAKLLHKAKLKAERMRQRREQEQMVSEPESKRRRLSLDTIPSNRATSSSRSSRSSGSRQSSESNKDDQTAATSSLEDCVNECITRDVRIMLSDINYPGSEFSKKIESYNAASHADQIKPKENQEAEVEEQPEEQSEEEMVPHAEKKSDDQSELRDSDAEPAEGLEVENESEREEQENVEGSWVSDDISLLSMLSNDSNSGDSIALDYQAGDGPSLSEMQVQAERASLDGSAEDAEHELPAVPDDGERRDEASVSEESEEVEALLDEMVTKVVSQQLSHERENSPEPGGVSSWLEMEPHWERNTRDGQDGPQVAESKDQNAEEEVACHDSVTLVLDEMVSLVSNECESNVDLLHRGEVLCESGSTKCDCTQGESCSENMLTITATHKKPDVSDLESSDSVESVGRSDSYQDALPGQTLSKTSLPSGCEVVSDGILTPDATSSNALLDSGVELPGFFSQTAELTEEVEGPVGTQDEEEFQDVALMEEKCHGAERQVTDESESQNKQMTETAMEYCCLADAKELAVSGEQNPVLENTDVGLEAEHIAVSSHDASEEQQADNMPNHDFAANASSEQDAHVISTTTCAESRVKDEVPEEVIDVNDPSSRSDEGVKASSSQQLVESIKVEVKEEVEEVTAPPPPPKRGRGRPRKRPLESDSSSSERPQSSAAKAPKVELEDEDGRSTLSMKTRLKKATQGQVLNQMYYNALRDATCMTKTPKTPTDPCLRDASLSSPRRAKRESPLRRPSISTRSRRCPLFPRRGSPYKELQEGRASRQSPQKGVKAATTRRLSSQSPPGNYPRQSNPWELLSPPRSSSERSSSERSSKQESKAVATSPARPRGRPPLRPPTAAVTPVGRISSSVGAVTSPKSGRAARGEDRQRGTSAPTPWTRASRSRSNSGAAGARVPLCRPNHHDTARGQQESSSHPPSSVALPVPRVTTPETASETPAASTGCPKASKNGIQEQLPCDGSPSVSSLEPEPDAEKSATENASPPSYQGSYVNFLSTCGLNPDHNKVLDAQRSPVSETKLEGVKVLRDSIKKQPFRWDVEEEDGAGRKAEKDLQNTRKDSQNTEKDLNNREKDSKKVGEKDTEKGNKELPQESKKEDSETTENDDSQAVEAMEDLIKTEKEPIKVLREQVSVAPFTWDLDESEDNQSPPRKRRRRSIRNRGDSSSHEKDDVKDAATSVECQGVLQNVMLTMMPSLEIVVVDNGSGEGGKEVAVKADVDNTNTTNTDTVTPSGDKPDQKVPQAEKPSATNTESKVDEASSEAGQPSGRFGRGRLLRSRTQMVQDTKSMPAVVRKSGVRPGRGRSAHDGNLMPRIQVYRVDPVTHEKEAKPRASRIAPGNLSSRTVHTPVPIEDMKKGATGKTASQSEGGSDTKNWTIAKKAKTNYPYSFTRARGQKK